MALPNNLVSDSTLVQEVVDVLRVCGGRAAVEQIAEVILELPRLDAPTAALLVAELIKDDWRMRLVEPRTVELLCEDAEARALRDTDFVVVDVETTDARTPPGRIMELGAYRVRQGRIVAEFKSLVNPETPIPSFIVGLTGINDEMVRRAPRFAEIASAWLQFADMSVLVAHNASFDVRFLNHELARVYPGQRMCNTHLCTVKLARRLMPELVNHRLHTIAEHFAVPIPNRHRAPDDARATAEIFIRLLAQLDRQGVRDLASARRYKAEGRGQRAEVG
ncbi:MAG TPA: exonuclease domain-containing protein [Pyrinomonadaceae bacterium]|nr:exonuclease domain-containing protein [Pyrinomonadaceae bacterium]